MFAPVQSEPQRRRGTRIQAQIPVRITSLDPAASFSENCYTMTVNPQGCGLRCSRPLATGLQIRVDELPGRKTALARVANTRLLAAGSKFWIVGIALESPGNLWCIKPAPADWKIDALPTLFSTSQESRTSAPAALMSGATVKRR